MTPEQISFFRDEGYLLLKSAVPKPLVKPLVEHVRSELERAKLGRDGRGASPLRKLPPFQQVTKLGQRIRAPTEHAGALAVKLRSLVDALSAVRAPVAQPMELLLSLPLQGEWTLQGLPWHVDVSSLDPQRVPGVQAFVLLDDVASRGGGTLALARSHRLEGGDESRRRFRELLKSSRDLEKELGDAGSSLVEMSGRAGDVYLMDMRLLHSPSINATKQLRLMATVRFLAT